MSEIKTETAMESAEGLLAGAFKSIEWIKFTFQCLRCNKEVTKTVANDIPANISCPSCGMLHTAYPNVPIDENKPN